MSMNRPSSMNRTGGTGGRLDTEAVSAEKFATLSEQEKKTVARKKGNQIL